MEGGEVEGRATNEWELSKENIQPLKQGRNMAKLSHSLHQQDEDTVRAIQEERRGFEEELRSYAGEDALDPWYRYIQVGAIKLNKDKKYLFLSLCYNLMCSGWSRPTPREGRTARSMCSSRNVSRSLR